MKSARVKVAVLSAIVLAAALVAAGPPIGFEALGNFDHLWQWSGKVHTAMQSSTDPTGGNMDMNYDQGKYKGEKVLARVDGPGCIYRIWSAAPSGTIKVYIDGARKPEIKCGFKNYLEGKCEGLPSQFSVGRTANYMPVPFAKSIVITAPGFHFPAYYQVSYQTYDASVPVESFTMAKAMDEKGLGDAKAAWSVSQTDISPFKVFIQQAEVNLAQYESIKVDGPAVIRRLTVMNPDDPADPLAGVTMQLTWDDADNPAVDAPVDAFFMNRFNLKDKWPGGSLHSLFIKAGPEGYESTFPMPFKKSARIGFDGKVKDKKIRVLLEVEMRPDLPDNTMNFRAAFKEADSEPDYSKDVVITNRTPIDPATNYVVLDRRGKGNYVGCALFVESVGTVWWGEGDENTWIDNAAEPQIKGTGTEDEFNWSWGYTTHMSPVSGTLPVIPPCKESRAAVLIPQIRNEECRDIRGENVAYRFRPGDYVPFSEHIKVSYEVLGSTWQAPHGFIKGNLGQHRGDDYSSVAYWYEAP